MVYHPPQQFNIWQFLKRSVVANVGLVLLAIPFCYGAYRMTKQAFLFSDETRSARQQIEALTQKKQGLEAYLAELKTASAVEREAKERLNLKNPGEKVVVILPEEQRPIPPPPPLTFIQRTRLFFAGIVRAVSGRPRTVIPDPIGNPEQ